MNKSPKYDLVKKYYDAGLWSFAQVACAVIKKWITAEEFEKITGQPYVK